MNKWAKSTLGEILPLKYGKNLPAPQRMPGGVPVYSSAGQIGYHVTPLVSSPCIVIGRKGSVGTVYYEKRNCFPIDTTFYTTGSSKIDLKFGYYALLHADLAQYSQDSAVPGLNRDRYSEISISVPPIQEQEAISDVLGAFDDKIDANTKLATVSDDLALSLLSACPATVPVSEIVSYKKGSINVSTLKSSTVAHFSLPAFDTGKLPVLCDPDEIKSNKAYVQAPSVLISKLNPRFPRVWDLLELPSEPAVASTEFLVLEPRFSSTSVLWTILSQEEFGRELETKVAGTSGSHQRIKPSDLLATKAIDPRNINVEIQQLITSLCQISFHCRRENRHLEATRDALLPPLMSGKLRVKDAEKIVEAAV